MEKYSKIGDKLYYSLVLAICKNNGIGFKGKLPWSLSMDMKHFKTITTKTFDNSLTSFNMISKGFISTANEMFKSEVDFSKLQKESIIAKNMVVMGRTTWNSLPNKFKPLPDRINVILSKSEEFHKNNNNIEGTFYVVKNTTQLFELASKLKKEKVLDEIYIIGGNQIYTEFLSKHPDNCKLIFQTNIEKAYECDTFFSLPNNFQPLTVSKTFVDSKDTDATFDFRILINKNIIKDSKLMENFNEVVNPYFLEQYPRHEEFQYLDAIKDIIETGVEKNDRTGVGVLSKFGIQMKFDCSSTFPLLTTKETFWRGIVEELIWFVKGETNAKKLEEKKIFIWSGNGSRSYLDSIGLKDREEGDLGPVYGFQWRYFGADYKTMHDNYDGQGVNQLNDVIDQIQNKPNSRRILLSAWNPKDLHKMALPPCHVLSQFYVSDGKLSLKMYQRSGDMGLGIPFNIASYSLLLRMIAHITGLQPGEFIHTIGDAHIYKNHVEQLKEQLKRIPKAFPILQINPNVKNITDFTFKDFKLINYSFWPKIKMDMAV